MNDPTMSEVPPPRTKAPAPAQPAQPPPLPPPPTQRPGENLRVAYAADSDLETETQAPSRPEQTDDNSAAAAAAVSAATSAATAATSAATSAAVSAAIRADYAKIMSRIDDIESLLAKHISIEATAKAGMCTSLEKYANTVVVNSALLEKTIDVMKGIQAEVTRITWERFEEAVKPVRTTVVGQPIEPVEPVAAQTIAETTQAGGYGWVVSKEPTPTPGHNTMRIEKNEFLAIKEDGNLKHVWVYVDAFDEKAHKMRVQSLAALDVSNVYANGGCLFPYMKSCGDVDRFFDFRIRFLVGQHYTHCRPKS